MNPALKMSWGLYRRKFLTILLVVLWPLDRYVLIHPINILLVANGIWEIAGRKRPFEKFHFFYLPIFFIYLFSILNSPEVPRMGTFGGQLSLVSTPPYDQFFSCVRLCFILCYSLVICPWFSDSLCKFLFLWTLRFNLVLLPLNLIYYLLFYLTGANPLGLIRDETTALYPQLQSISIEPQAFGNYLILVLGVLFLQGFRSPILNGWLFLLIAGNLVLTLSTGAFLLLILILSLQVILQPQKKRKISIILFSVGVLFSSLYFSEAFEAQVGKVSQIVDGSTSFLIGQGIFSDTGSFFFSSAGARITCWQVAIRQFLSYPISGVGPDRYGLFFEEFNFGRSGEVINQPPQNLLFGLLANLGVLGGVVFLVYFLWPFLGGFLVLLKSQRPSPIMRTVFFSFLCCFALQMQAWNFSSYKVWFFTILLRRRCYFKEVNT